MNTKSGIISEYPEQSPNKQKIIKNIILEINGIYKDFIVICSNYEDILILVKCFYIKWTYYCYQ